MELLLAPVQTNATEQVAVGSLRSHAFSSLFFPTLKKENA